MSLRIILFLLTFSCKTMSVNDDNKEGYTIVENENGTLPASAKINFDAHSYVGQVRVSDKGVLENKVILYLDYFPNGQFNKANLPTCYKKFDENQVVGELKCDGNIVHKVKFLNIIQRCKIKSSLGKESYSLLSGMVNCKNGQLNIFGFTPQLSVRVE